eukprot:sb/3465127/
MGKERTKGEKEIRAANAETLKFYKSVVSATLVVYAVVRWFLGFSWFHVFMSISAATTLSLTYGSMSSAAAGGTDLNMDGGLTDYLKDILLVTAGVTILSLFSDYCWYLWLIIPLFALGKLWTGIIKPWIFAPAPEEPANMGVSILIVELSFTMRVSLWNLSNILYFDILINLYYGRPGRLFKLSSRNRPKQVNNQSEFPDSVGSCCLVNTSLSEMAFGEGGGGRKHFMGSLVTDDGNVIGGGNLPNKFVHENCDQSIGLTVNHSELFFVSCNKNSQRKIVEEATRVMVCIANRLKLAQQHIESAVMFYKMALSKRILQGKRKCHVCAACLYIEPTGTSKQPIITRYLGHVTGYQPIGNQLSIFPDSVGSDHGAPQQAHTTRYSAVLAFNSTPVHFQFPNHILIRSHHYTGEHV